jgi:NADH-quinone oxidoreductase subunit H
VSSGIMISLFFGGWHLGSNVDGFMLAHLPNVAFVAAMATVWLAKVFAFCSFQLLIRWSLPRFRSDQLMRLGWQRLLPVSIANVVATALLILWSQASH